METQAVEIIETEVPLEKAMSLNHSRLTGRIVAVLLAHEDRYDILPELDLELRTGRAKPDVAVIPKQAYNWREDVIHFPQPPITTIEILSPTQSFDYLASKIDKIYLAGGVKSAWLVVPFVNNIHLFLPDGSITTVANGSFHDPVTDIEFAVADIFR